MLSFFFFFFNYNFEFIESGRTETIREAEQYFKTVWHYLFFRWYFFSYEAEISSCFVQLLHVHQGKVSYLGPNYFFNRIGACKGRFQSQQLRMFCPLELCLALASTETSNFHAKFNQDIKNFFTLDKKIGVSDLSSNMITNMFSACNA